MTWYRTRSAAAQRLIVNATIISFIEIYFHFPASNNNKGLKNWTESDELNTRLASALCMRYARHDVKLIKNFIISAKELPEKYCIFQ